jgi:hypothetical protein
VAGWWFTLGIPVSSTNKTDRHDIAENNITLTLVEIVENSTLILTSI